MREGSRVRRSAISDAIFEAMAATLIIPPGDRFMIFTSAYGSRVYDRSFFGVTRTDETIFVDVRLRRGRSADQKRAFCAMPADLLKERIGLSPGDLFITLAENGSEDWSFGDGVAQMAPAEVVAN
jgi:hypothetical protein